MGFLSFRRAQDCSGRMGIDPTAAQVSNQCIANFLFAGVRVFVQQVFGVQQHTWSAETALDGTMFEEGLLQRM